MSKTSPEYLTVLEQTLTILHPQKDYQNIERPKDLVKYILYKIIP